MVNLVSPPASSSDPGTTEFYTIESTGESGMSQSGLAILCGVTQPAISTLIGNLSSRSPSQWLKPLVGEELILISNKSNPDLTINNKKAGSITIYKSEVCSRIITHYAFQGNDVAQYSLEQFMQRGIESWIQSITGWGRSSASQSYIPYWYKRLTLFTSKTRIPDGWWSVFEELAKLMRELEGYGYVIPDRSVIDGKRITPDISIGKMFCRYMRGQGYSIDNRIKKYRHYYPDGREVDANIYPDEWIEVFRSWFNSTWKRERLIKYLGSRDPDSLPYIHELLQLPEAKD
jgi:hypothetical protein